MVDVRSKSTFLLKKGIVLKLDEIVVFYLITKRKLFRHLELSA